MNRGDRYIIGALGLVLALVVGLVLMPNGSSGPKPSPSLLVVPPYREIVVGHPSSINPLTPRTQADQDLVALLFRGLVRAGQDGTILPDLAMAWSISADGRTYTFHLSPDAFWEDGQTVTSADVVFTIGLLQDPAYDGPYGSSWQGIHVAADGAYTVKFTMVLAIAGFLRQAALPILPEHLLASAEVVTLADNAFSRKPIGDGPYRILTLDYNRALLGRVTSVTPAYSQGPSLLPTPTPGPSTSTAAGHATIAPTPTPTPAPTATPTPTVTPTPMLAASPSSAATPGPSPTPEPTARPTRELTTSVVPLSTIELDFFDDSSSAAAAFKAGGFDAVGGLSPEGVDMALTATDSHLVSYRWTSLLSVVVNQRSTHPELQDANVRAALLAAIDRSLLLAKLLGGRGSLADLPIPAWSSVYDDTSVSPIAYDPVAAGSALAAAGWLRTTDGWAAPKATDPYNMHLLVPTEASNALLYRAGLTIAAEWTAIGFKVTLDVLPVATYVARLGTGDFTAAVVDFEVGLDPDLGPLLLSSQVGSGGSNVAGIQDPTLDGLLQIARKTVDPIARHAAVSAVEKYISTAVPILPLMFRDYDVLTSNRVRNVFGSEIADPSNRFWDVIDWRLASDG